MKRQQLLVGLDGGVGVLSSYETFDVEDGVDGVLRGLVLGGVADESGGFGSLGGEGHVGGGDAIAQFVGTDFDAGVTPDGDAGVRGSLDWLDVHFDVCIVYLL